MPPIPQVAAFNDNPDPVAAGDEATYSVRVDNNGADSSLNTVLTRCRRRPAPTASTPRQAWCARSVRWPPAGPTFATATSYCVRWARARPRLNLNATVSADKDVNLANNTPTQTTPFTSGANLALGKTGAPNPVVGGANVSYTLRQQWHATGAVPGHQPGQCAALVLRGEP